MNIVFATSELSPFAKTGGLADVSQALPVALAGLGHQVTVFVPGYRSVWDAGHNIQPTRVEIEVQIGTRLVTGRLWQCQVPGTNVQVFFIAQGDYFDREGLYGEQGSDYEDNCERFVFFSRAVLESCGLLNLHPDLVHVNDWQTSLIPALLQCEFQGRPGFENIASLLTIHNLAYQGNFWHWDMVLTGLDWKHFNWRELEFHGRLNLLKTAIVFSDAINTVSPTYAREIQTPEFGCGLDPVLRFRRQFLSGILNGIDPQDWNPSTDDHLWVNYDATCWEQGKRANRQCLSAHLGIPFRPQAPLVGSVGRLVSQKGWQLTLQVLGQWLENSDLQWIVLGTGDAEIEQSLVDLSQRNPEKLFVHVGFSDELARRITAASDIFLMPSQFEPCGLNQQYSMAYGTVPIVHRTGGLADTVNHASALQLSNRCANGFVFDSFDVEHLNGALIESIRLFLRQPDDWAVLVQSGMNQDWSWRNSSRQYERLYRSILARRREPQSFASGF